MPYFNDEYPIGISEAAFWVMVAVEFERAQCSDFDDWMYRLMCREVMDEADAHEEFWSRKIGK